MTLPNLKFLSNKYEFTFPYSGFFNQGKLNCRQDMRIEWSKRPLMNDEREGFQTIYVWYFKMRAYLHNFFKKNLIQEYIHLYFTCD